MQENKSGCFFSEIFKSISSAIGYKLLAFMGCYRILFNTTKWGKVAQVSDYSSQHRHKNTFLLILPHWSLTVWHAIEVKTLVRTLCSASRHQLLVPRYQLSSLGRRSFAVTEPTTGNSLSADLRDPTCSDESFRRSLKTFLFAKY